MKELFSSPFFGSEALKKCGKLLLFSSFMLQWERQGTTLAKALRPYFPLPFRPGSEQRRRYIIHGICNF
jgi:hypothetical protein